MPEVDVIRAQLFALQDKEYQIFNSRLMPTLPPETVIGVRVPLLRKLAKQLANTPEAEVFLQELPHFYYEENASTPFCWRLSGITAQRWRQLSAFCPMWITGQSAIASAPRCLRSISRSCCLLSGAGWALTGRIPCATGSGC